MALSLLKIENEFNNNTELTMKLLVQVPVGNEYLKNYYENLEKAHKDDAGIDLIAPEDMDIYPFQMAVLNLQVKCCLLSENENPISYWLVPRSSISKTGMMMANSIGLIDAGYRGNIGLPLRYIPADFGKLLQNILTNIIITFVAIFLNWIIFKNDKITAILGICLFWITLFPTIWKLAEPYHIKKGDRLAQICASNLDHIEIEITDDTLPESSRGSNGFGSTGQ